MNCAFNTVNDDSAELHGLLRRALPEGLFGESSLGINDWIWLGDPRDWDLTPRK